MSAWDVVVVGGGPAGACAARAALREGVRVLLLERDALPAERICGEYLCPGAVRDLRSLGFGPVLGALRSRPLRGMRLHSPGGREVVTRFPAESPGLSVRRFELDPLLVEECGAEAWRGAKVVHVETGPDAAWLRLADGSCVEAAVVIGADGRHGVVAREAGLWERVPARRTTLHAYYTAVAGTSEHGEMHLPGDGSYFGLNPGPDDRVNVTFVTDLHSLGDDLRPRAPTILDGALARCATLRERFAGARLDSEVRALAPLEVRVRSVASDRVLLAGDAAGFLDPLTGEGMYGAVVSGRLA
ncbi:MAG: NAD(P)/FAD-dependent oxidoreductase, partial [Planctomycetota bacterium]